MKPTHPVELIVCGIATQEGWFGDKNNIPVVRNNPGDLRYAEQLNASAPGWDGKGVAPIATFTKPSTGITGAFRDVWAKVAKGVTLRELIAVYAPAGVDGNDTTEYLKNMLAWTGLPADTPILDLLPPLVKLN
jgi:hypothetical protein